MTDKILLFKKERERLRSEWRGLRDLKLSRKRELASRDAEIEVIRRDKLYREYRKSQNNVSKKIKHLEIKINRYLSRKRENVI
jgi:hypothetical protein